VPLHTPQLTMLPTQKKRYSSISLKYFPTASELEAIGLIFFLKLFATIFRLKKKTIWFLKLVSIDSDQRAAH
jgi:hypothetical protein